MYKKLLVPLDGSKRAEAILPHVESLARCVDAKILLLCVYRADFSLVNTYGHGPEFYEAIREQCREEAVIYLKGVEDDLSEKGFQVRSLAEEGDVTDTIQAVAKGEDASLIAMSSHGRTGLAQVIFGSVASSVLHRADRPLLLIRSDQDE